MVSGHCLGIAEYFKYRDMGDLILSKFIGASEAYFHSILHFSGTVAGDVPNARNGDQLS